MQGGGGGSPAQGAPASCRPGDGLDIASPLSSEEKGQKDKGRLLLLLYFHEAIKRILHPVSHQSRHFLIIWRKYFKPMRARCIHMLETCIVYQVVSTRFAELTTQWSTARTFLTFLLEQEIHYPSVDQYSDRCVWSCLLTQSSRSRVCVVDKKLAEQCCAKLIISVCQVQA